MMQIAEVIQLDAFRGKPNAPPVLLRVSGPQCEDGETETPRERRMRERQAQAIVTETGRNSRLRQERRIEWYAADALVEYWHCMFRLEDAISSLQRCDLPEGKQYAERDHARRDAMLENYRAALMAQLLTPAPDAGAVTWKRNKLKIGEHRRAGMATERIERAIAEDAEFLRTHPTRRQRTN